jgi:hypothetical protein
MRNFTLLQKTLIVIGALVIFLALLIFTAPEPTGTAQLSWNANTEPDFAGYKIYYGDSPRSANCPPGGYAHNITVGNSTSHTVKELSAGKTYYFSITAYDTAGQESGCSSEVSKQVSVSSDASAVTKFTYAIKNKISALWKK